MQGGLSVIVDNREGNGDLLSRLESQGVAVTVRPLPVGDYVISDRVCIERKTVSDFEGSIVSGRLFEQAERLSEAYERPMIIIEGDREEFRMKGTVISGAMAALYIDYDIPVIETGGPEESAEMIRHISRHEQEGRRREPSVKGAGRAFTESQFMERIIGNIPGIGPQTARSLLGHFGSVRAVADAAEKDYIEVPNIGEKRARLIFRVLNGRYDPESGRV